MITAEMVKALREKTGAGMMDCKRALTDTDGDFEKALEILKEKGLDAATKKADRVVAEGLIYSYIHGNGRIGVLVEINCETDFVAKNPEFVELCRDVSMQIAAMNPLFVQRQDVSDDYANTLREEYRVQALEEGKSPNFLDKIITGRLEKFYKETCLLEQAYIKDDSKTIAQLVSEKISIIGENISIRRFARFVVGEGMEKKQGNLAEEVAALRFK